MSEPQLAADAGSLVRQVMAEQHLSAVRVAEAVGDSYAAVCRWLEGQAEPSPETFARLVALGEGKRAPASPSSVFASRGARRARMVEAAEPSTFSKEPHPPILERLSGGSVHLTSERDRTLTELLAKHTEAAVTVEFPPSRGMSAGKNTYTYDAHTYHTKVPPQGIAELLKHYLPSDGLVLDPFAGSGMTGVAARAVGLDCVLNELSPAAAFIANRFTTQVDPGVLRATVDQILESLSGLRRSLYHTTCRECSSETELRYTVWSYRVVCPACEVHFNLWDACRSYGRTVREHKILSSFPCPGCGELLKKARLERTQPEPVQVAYMCCGSRQQEVVHPPDEADLALIRSIEERPPLAEGFYPTRSLPNGVNLGQPIRHGIDSVDKFYTARGLAVMSHLWRELHRIDDTNVAGFAAFIFTSLYRRVTRLSEFRFWGGSGNTARLNVPYIFDEANIFRTFERKANAVLDHLETTARHYRADVIVMNGSATDLSTLPDDSIDLIFTDPPFGGNINYSEMNLLWESWLDRFTDSETEAIINRVQGKDVDDYRRLMKESLSECYRVLRPGHWMLLVFMNSSESVWRALMDAVEGSGFLLVTADIFDKQHGTFKHFVSENTPGADLVLHCLKPDAAKVLTPLVAAPGPGSLGEFLAQSDLSAYRTEFLHVERAGEANVRKLYSEWVANCLVRGRAVIDYASFGQQVALWLTADSVQDS